MGSLVHGITVLEVCTKQQTNICVLLYTHHIYHCKTGLFPVDIPAISPTVCGVGCRRSCSLVTMSCKLRGISVRGGIITFIANESNRFHFSG